MQRRHLLRTIPGMALAGWAGAGRATASGKIVLGQSAAFTGPAAQLGEQFRRGAMLHFDVVNARGGIAGRPIELMSLDDDHNLGGFFVGFGPNKHTGSGFVDLTILTAEGRVRR